MSSLSERGQEAEDAYCPHCHLVIEAGAGDDLPPEPQRCPHCRLLIGAGRARSEPSDEPGARGSAAGVFAHQAKRSGAESDVSDERRLQRHPQRRREHRRPSRAAADGGLPAAGGRRRQPARGWPTCSRPTGAGSAPGGPPPIPPDASSPRHRTGKVESRPPWKSCSSWSRFSLAGLAVIFIAFSGGPAAAREAYLTRGGRGFRIAHAAALRGSRRSRAGSRDRFARRVRGRRGQAPHRRARPRPRRRASTSSARPAGAATTSTPCQAQGVTGPDLDDLGLDRAARAQRDRAWRHRRRAHAGRPAPGRGSARPWRPTWPRSPASSAARPLSFGGSRRLGRRRTDVIIFAQDAALFRPTVPLCW